MDSGLGGYREMKGNNVKVKELTAIELNRAAYRIIACELGVGGLIRFIQEHSLGAGNYTRDRHQWLPRKSVKELAADIKMWKKTTR